MTDIHSCGYYCDRPGCIKAQRDELRDRLAQPEPEPLGNVEYIPCCTDQTCPKCKAATPPQQRKPLTDEEILDECDVVPTYDVGNSDLIKFARAIEAAHGIKE